MDGDSMLEALLVVIFAPVAWIANGIEADAPAIIFAGVFLAVMELAVALAIFVNLHRAYRWMFRQPAKVVRDPGFRSPGFPTRQPRDEPPFRIRMPPGVE